jgi:hypothetical protein
MIKDGSESNTEKLHEKENSVGIIKKRHDGDYRMKKLTLNDFQKMYHII